MKKATRRLMWLILLLVFVISTALLLRQFSDNAGGDDAYSEALSIASGVHTGAETELPEVTEQTTPKSGWIPAPVEDDDPNMEIMAAIDLDALREVNEDVIGWIYIPNSKINYPLLQGDDNEYYLNHAWDHRSTSVGSIFLEHLNSADLTDYNTIIYGHNMNDGSMFAGLKKYSTMGYWEKHRYIYIVSDAGIYRYEVFASYKAPVDSATYGLSFHQTETKETFLFHAIKSSKIQPEIIPAKTDRILTLSTCSGGGYTNRWVVQARLPMIEVEQ